MLLLFETAAGYALFKVLKEGKLQEAEVRAAFICCAETSADCIALGWSVAYFSCRSH